MNQPPLWKASVFLTKAEAADVAASFELTGAQAVMTAEEPFDDEAEVEALYAQMPDGDLLSKLAGHEVRVILLPDTDWIKLSQEGLPPVRAGRFFVYGAHDKGKVPPGVIPMRIEAGMAFGTGHHETTALCLAVLSDLAKRRRFARALDLGCGTGLLAIGAAKLWRRRVLASDIDPEAIAVTRQNAAINGEAPLVRALMADGLTHPALARTAPFDLIVANILAGPLTQLAPGHRPRAGAEQAAATAVSVGRYSWPSSCPSRFAFNFSSLSVLRRVCCRISSSLSLPWSEPRRSESLVRRSRVPSTADLAGDIDGRKIVHAAEFQIDGKLAGIGIFVNLFSTLKERCGFWAASTASKLSGLISVNLRSLTRGKGSCGCPVKSPKTPMTKGSSFFSIAPPVSTS